MKKAKKKTKRGKTGLLKGLIILGFWLMAFILVTFLSAFAYYARQIPDPETIITRRISETTKIFDRTGKTVLYNIHGEEKRTIIPIEEIPEIVKLSIIATEDVNFYLHRGLDLKGVIRAAITNIQSRAILQGGSTITQQLIKNSILSRERTFARKFKETILALEIERRFSKEEIIWMYLNQISYGSNIFGIESAAQSYFGKPTKELTLNESAVLASLVKAPTYYSPYGSNKDKLIERKNNLLERMKNLSFIDQEEFDEALEEELEFEGNDKGILAPHFVIMVREYLVKKYGNDLVQNGGLKVYTTLDWDLQQLAEETINKYAKKNEESYNAKNASLVATDPKTGQILTLVGSRDYFDIENEGNFNTATALRQPGSAFKPIAYSVAIDKGYTDKTILFDVKTEFNPECSPNGIMEKDRYGLDCYHPKNYTNRFRGPVTLRQSLANSLNLPSVKVLYLSGIQDVIARAQDIGITSLSDPSRFGLSLVLGGAEIRLKELVGAFAAFANDGVFNEITFILKVETPDGKILEQFKEQPQRTISTQTARVINSILSDNFARAQVFGLQNSLYFKNRIVAAKTGTTQDNRDAWTIGYTPSLAVGVWTGNNDNSRMTKNAAGVVVAGPLWHEFFQIALRNYSIEEFSQPEPVFVDKIMLNGNYIYKNIDGNQEVNTILSYVNKKDPLGPILLNPESDPQFKNWQWAVKNFFSFPSPLSSSASSSNSE